MGAEAAGRAEDRDDGTLPLLVLGSATCEDTAVIRSRLVALGIPFHESDVDLDPAAADRMVALNDGQRVTPTLVFGADRLVVAEPTLERLGELLAIAGYTVEPPRAVDYHGELVTRSIPFQRLPAVDGGSVSLEALRGRRQVVLFLGHTSGCLACFGYARQLAARHEALAAADAVVLIVVDDDVDGALGWRHGISADVGILADSGGSWKREIARHVRMPADAADLLMLDRFGAPRAGSSAAEAGGLIDPSDAVDWMGSLDLECP